MQFSAIYNGVDLCDQKSDSLGNHIFWVILGVSQANFTPSVEFTLFHYDAIRYWMVHLGLVLLAIYPAIAWKWMLEFKDVLRTFFALNGIALIIYGFNVVLNSNYMYLMGKPPGTTFTQFFPNGHIIF